MVSTQSINSKLQKHQQYSPRERAAVSSKTADSELSTTENSRNSVKKARVRLGKGLPVMVSTQSINSKLQKHQQYSPRERAAVSSKTADSELSTAKIAATRSKKLGSDWEKDCQRWFQPNQSIPSSKSTNNTLQGKERPCRRKLQTRNCPPQK